MNIDLDQILQTAKPWNLSLTLDGLRLPVRRCTAADVKRIQDAGRYGEEENRAFVTGLFGDQAANVQWDAERVSLVITAVISYYNETVLRKNVELATRAVAAAMTTRTPGSGE